MVKRELRTLSKDNAAGVAKHLVMVERLLESDPERARAHADHIVGRAGRVATVRETRGLVAYHEGDWKVALNEFRTARRLSGSNHLLPYLVDIERALGRPERALELAATPEALTLERGDRIELDIVIAGVRQDMGDLDAALVQLQGPELDPSRRRAWSGRLFYAYASLLLAAGRTEEARAWFSAAIEADPQLDTEAAERIDEIDGVVFTETIDEDAEEDAEAGEAAPGAEDTNAGAPEDAQDDRAAESAHRQAADVLERDADATEANPVGQAAEVDGSLGVSVGEGLAQSAEREDVDVPATAEVDEPVVADALAAESDGSTGEQPAQPSQLPGDDESGSASATTA